MEAMQFNEVFSALPMEGFQNQCIIVFDLTSLQDALSRTQWRKLEIRSLFPSSLEQVTEVIVLGERLSTFILTNMEQSLKLFNFLSFQIPIKIL